MTRSTLAQPLLQAGSAAARLLPAETAHAAGLWGLRAMAPVLGKPARTNTALTTSVAGLTIISPVGLAAGFDKNAVAIDPLLSLGFGFVEVGAVTPRAQPGNAKPRVFRLAKDKAVINRFGFNNQGMEAVAARLEARIQDGARSIVGVNLGANKDSEDKAADYAAVLSRLWGLAQFFTVNVSSPNTPGLRDLQGADALRAVLDRVGEARAGLSGEAPIFVKLAPDLDETALDHMTEVFAAHHIVDGLIVSNTTITRPDSLQSKHKTQAGGLSGRPVFDASTAALKGFAQRLASAGNAIPLIGVGGVEDGATAYAKIRAGASAVQLYTAMVYQGPAVIARIESELAALLQADGFASLKDAVGADL